MTLDINSYAAAVGSAVRNVQFQPSSQIVPRKILIIGSFDETVYTTVAADVPMRITNAAQVGALVGYGSMLHRLAFQAFQGSQGIETWMIPQNDAAGAAAATGTITITGAATESGYVHLYVAGLRVLVSVSKGDDKDAVKASIIAAVADSRNIDVPVLAVDGGAGIVTVTAKSKGAFWGNNITVRLNLTAGEELPAGLTVVMSSDKLTGGTGLPDIQSALDALGTGDDANLQYFTDVVHGYGQDAGTLDDISGYVGEGDGFVGLYQKIVGRPFRVLTGDTAAGTDALTALSALGNGRKLDRGNGIIAAPGSASHPSEIAAQTIGHLARINNVRAEECYIDVVLIDIDPGYTETLGASTGRWTSLYDNRDTAVKDGISPTKVQNGVLVLQNVVTFYHPDDIPLESNGYKSMRNISIVQNILSTVLNTFKRDKWKGISIVADVQAVGYTESKEKSRDIDSVLDELVSIARELEKRAWIYTADFTIANLPGAVAIRAGGTGFDNVFKVIFSGEGLILDTVTEFDINVGAALS